MSIIPPGAIKTDSCVLEHSKEEFDTETIKLLRSIEISSHGLFDSKPNMVTISALGNMSEGDDYIS